ncbi:Pyridoxal reductase,chloroplastic [Ceratobasidium theobromae]|uniref:Pyridoxal reductase,chloroplastic n=1 Tax=Ceratobasidium theobromae TaxID=1582974 RepID=A0A5N5QH82_9AGAM|nr:Pyridoxal reductase,chloroplastic [Ceratobasidium theobromae]
MLPTTSLGPLNVPRVWTGLWQLSSPAWGTAPAARIKREMARHAAEGYTAFGGCIYHTIAAYSADMVSFLRSMASADPRRVSDSDTTTPLIHPSRPLRKRRAALCAPFSSVLYDLHSIPLLSLTPQGQFRESLPDPKAVVGATKWCVFVPTDIDRNVVQDAIDERIARMRSDPVDLLQVGTRNPISHLIPAVPLAKLRRQGIPRRPRPPPRHAQRGPHHRPRPLQFRRHPHRRDLHTPRPTRNRLQPGPGASSPCDAHLTRQFSLVDTRPLDGMADVCQKHAIKLLTYGSLCGGFLADKWLGAPEPDAYRETMTPSQRKYLDMILSAWGSWSLFQSLLAVLRAIADRYTVSIANVSTRWVLEHPFVGAVIIGARLGVSEHTEDNSKVFSFSLSSDDHASIQTVLQKSNGRHLVRTIGDCGSEYR